MDLATEELRAKLLPASRKLKDFEKERSERRKVRKKTKQVVSPVPESIPLASGSVVSTGDVEILVRVQRGYMILLGSDFFMFLVMPFVYLAL